MSEYNIQMNRYNALNVEYDQLYPATKIENVDGLDTALQNKASKTHASQHASGGADPITPAAIGAAAAIHTHAAGDIISGILAVARGGTGVASLDELKTLLGISDASCKLEYGTYTGNGDSVNTNIQLSFNPNMLIILGGRGWNYSTTSSVSFLSHWDSTAQEPYKPGMTISLPHDSKSNFYISTLGWEYQNNHTLRITTGDTGYSIGTSGITGLPEYHEADEDCTANISNTRYHFLAIG